MSAINNKFKAFTWPIFIRKLENLLVTEKNNIKASSKLIEMIKVNPRSQKMPKRKWFLIIEGQLRC